MQHIFEYLINRKLTAKDANKNRLSSKLFILKYVKHSNTMEIIKGYNNIDNELTKHLTEDMFYDNLPDISKSIESVHDRLNYYQPLCDIYCKISPDIIENNRIARGSINWFKEDKLPKIKNGSEILDAMEKLKLGGMYYKIYNSNNDDIVYYIFKKL